MEKANSAVASTFTNTACISGSCRQYSVFYYVKITKAEAVLDKIRCNYCDSAQELLQLKLITQYKQNIHYNKQKHCKLISEVLNTMGSDSE